MPATYIPYATGGARHRAAHRRRAERQQPQGNLDNVKAAPVRPARPVRPYLLATFRPRKTEDGRKLTAPLFRELKDSLRANLPDNHFKDELLETTCFDSSFLMKAAEGVSESGMIRDAAVIIREGHARLNYREECDIWETDGTMCIAGLKDIRSASLKEAACTFLAALIDKQPFISVTDSVWYNVMETVLQENVSDGRFTDMDEESDLTPEDVMQEMRDAENVPEMMKDIRTRKDHSLRDVQRLLDAAKPEGEHERRLLEVMRSYVRFTGESIFDDSEFDADYNASVTVGGYDFFTLCHITELRPSADVLITAIYEGDVSYSPPVAERYLDIDGTIKDTLDYKGFFNMCSELSRALEAIRKDRHK